MAAIDVGVIGAGWCGGIRAESSAAHPLVDRLHIAEIRPDRLAEIADKTSAASAVEDYARLLENDDIRAFMISATPESTHYPIAKACLEAGRHVLLEKPIALTLEEADELIALARDGNLKFTIGYSQRFNHKFAYVKQCLEDGSIGKPVSALVSRNVTRSLGNKIAGRTRLSPAAMESTHDLDFVLWCLEPARPVRVYSQLAYGAMKEINGAPDIQWIMVTMDNGAVVTVGGGWSLPPAAPNHSQTWIEILGTEGALVVDDTHRDVTLSRMGRGAVNPMSSMPGELVGHVFAGAMAGETRHFIEAVALDRAVMATPEQARRVMEVYIAADLSADRGDPVTLPQNR